ncbi:DUF4145 domain-containing protein [Methylocystis sp.]|uniref:DUF4145 domain-containing protein n=1 Tax=Methylocystis sp. TaxID=1911079 RepID=UPI0025F83FB7|nr:DUF4145 domain-containing protein [Methylocystis sp.]
MDEMDWLEFFSKVIGDLAWPVVVLAIVLVLRKQIERAIGLINKVKVSGFEFEFDKKLDVAREEAAKLPRPKSPEDKEPEYAGQHAFELVEVSPRAAVIEAWRLVEAAAIDCGKRLFGADFSNKTMTFQAILRLENSDKLPASISTLMRRLRSLRNEAAHAAEFELSRESALEYVELSAQLIGNLNAIGKNGPMH